MRKTIVLLLLTVFLGGFANHLSAGTVDYIKSPMYGFFYRTYIALNVPGVPPFVQEGDYVREGDVVCMIDAMGAEWQIESPFKPGCTIHSIWAANGDYVEFDEILFIVLPR